MQGEQTIGSQPYVPYQAFTNPSLSAMSQPCESPYLAKPALEGSSQTLSQAYPWQSSYSPLGQPASPFLNSYNNALPSQSLNYSSYPADYSSSSQINNKSNPFSKGIGQSNALSTFDNNSNNQNNSSSFAIQSFQFNQTKSPNPETFSEKKSILGYQAHQDCAAPNDALSIGQIDGIKARVDNIIGNAKRNVEGQHHHYLMSASAVGSFKAPIPEYVSYSQTYSTQKQNDSVIAEVSHPEGPLKHRLLATSAMPFSGKWLDYSIPTDVISTKVFSSKQEDQSTKQIPPVNIGQPYSILNASSPYSNKNISSGHLFNPEIKPLGVEITNGHKNDNSYCEATKNVATFGQNTRISGFISTQTINNNNNISVDITNPNKVFLSNLDSASNKNSNAVYGERVNGIDNFKQLQDVNSRNTNSGKIDIGQNVQLGTVKFGYDLPSSGFGSPLNLMASKYGISKFDDSWRDDVKESEEIRTSLMPVSLRPQDIDYSSLVFQNSPLSQIVDKRAEIPDRGSGQNLGQTQEYLPKQEQQVNIQPQSLVGIAKSYAAATTTSPQKMNSNQQEIKQQLIAPSQTPIQVSSQTASSPVASLTKGSSLGPSFPQSIQRETEGGKQEINQTKLEKNFQKSDQDKSDQQPIKPINKDNSNQTGFGKPSEQPQVLENQDKKEQSSYNKISKLSDSLALKKDATSLSDEQEDQPKKTMIMLELNKWMDPTFQNFIKKNFSRQQKKELIEKLQRQIQSDGEDDSQEDSQDDDEEDSSKKDIKKKNNEKDQHQHDDQEESKNHSSHIKEIKTDAEQLEYIQFSERCKAELQRQKGMAIKQVDSSSESNAENKHEKLSPEQSKTEGEQQDKLEGQNIEKIKKSKKNSNKTADKGQAKLEEIQQLKKLNSDENVAMTAESKLLLQDIYDEVQHALKKYDYFIQEAQQKKLTSSLVSQVVDQNNSSLNNPGKLPKSSAPQQVHSEIPSETEIEKQTNQQNNLHRSNSMKSTLARDSSYFQKNTFSRPPSYSGHRTISIGHIRKEDSLIIGQNSLEKSLLQNEESLPAVKISKMDEEEAENAFNNRRQQIYKSLQNATKLRKSQHFLSQKPMNHSSSKIPGFTPSSYARTPSSSISSKSALGFSGQLQETHFLNASVISNSQTKASVLLQNVLSPKSTVHQYPTQSLNGSNQQQKNEECIDDKNSKLVSEQQPQQQQGQLSKDKQKSEMQSPKQQQQPQGIQKQQQQQQQQSQTKEDLQLSNSFSKHNLSPQQDSKFDQKYLAKPKTKYDSQQIFQSRQPYRQPSLKHQRITEDSLKALSKTVVSPLKRKTSTADEDFIKQTKRSQGSQILHSSSQEREKKEEEEFSRQEEALRQVGKLRQSIEMNITKGEKTRNVLQIDLLSKEAKEMKVSGKDVGSQKSQGKNEALLLSQKKNQNNDKGDSELKGVEEDKKQLTKNQKKLTNLRNSLTNNGKQIESQSQELAQADRKETEKEQIYLTEHLASQESILSTEIIEDQWKQSGDMNQQAQMINLRFSDEERKDEKIIKGNIASQPVNVLLKGVESSNNTFHQKKLAILCDIEDLNRQIQLENADNSRDEGQNLLLQNNNKKKKMQNKQINNQGQKNNANQNKNKQDSFSSDSLLLNDDLIIENSTVNLAGGDDIQYTKDDKIRKDSKSEQSNNHKQEEKEKRSSKRQSLEGQPATKPFTISIPSIVIKETESINKLPEETKQSALLIPLEQITPDTDPRQDGKRGKSLHLQGETHKKEARGKSEAPQRINSKNDTSDQEDQEEEKEEINLYRTVGSQNLAGFEKRNEKWIQARKNKLESTAKSQTNEQMKECTFKPHTNQYYQPSNSRMNKALKSQKPKTNNNSNNLSGTNNLSAKASTLNSYSSKRFMSQKQQTPEVQPPQKETQSIPAAQQGLQSPIMQRFSEVEFWSQSDASVFKVMTDVDTSYQQELKKEINEVLDIISGLSEPQEPVDNKPLGNSKKNQKKQIH